MYYTTIYPSPLGDIILAGTASHLTGLWFKDQKYFMATCPENAIPLENNASLPDALSESRRWLNIYFSGINPDFLPPLKLNGTPFQTEVWEILKNIPYGKTMTYGEIASLLAKQRGISSMSSQAVGNAVGRNPISIIIPCHRVIGSNGTLTGYAGGIERKQALLILEGIQKA